MPAYVVVHLAKSRSAPQLRDGARDESLTKRRDVKRLLSEHDGELIESAARQTVADAPTSTTTIAVPDMARANKLAAALRGLDGIETAYAKPGEELP